MEKLFTISANDILRILLSTLIIYVLVIIYIRLLGKRSTSQLNNFDWIVTVSIGSILSSTIVLEDVSVTDGGVSVLFLLLLQYFVTLGMGNFSFLRKIIKSTPQLLFLEGNFLDDNMAHARVLKVEIYAAIRQHGFKSLEDVYAVVLETNSKLSVLPQDKSGHVARTLYGVKGLPEDIESQIHDDNKL